jgi:NitT/TauT family transport system ATP-binding protein
MPGVPAVEFDAVSLSLGSSSVLRHVSFSIPLGQFTALVGPTGSGKTSILNLVAGLLTPTSGIVRASGKPVPAVNRDAAYMFQQDALLPWKTALENVVLGPLLRGITRRDATVEAERWIQLVGLRGFEHRYPIQLSGGQRKRVAMAQALINRLPLLLMDEPFSALDAQTRALMENELLGLWQNIAATVLFVTHDLEEAIALSDRVILLSAGPETTIKADYPVYLPRPRNVSEVRFMTGFTELYRQLWSDLKQEVMTMYERSRAKA